MAGASSLAAVQTAIAAILVGDSTLATLVGGVQNILGFEPEEPPAKFIILGNATEQEWHTFGGTTQGWGWDDTITVHIYSYQKGDSEVQDILARVTTLLNKPEGFAVTGYGTVICRYGEKITKTLIETVGKQQRRHIPAIFSVKVKE